MITKTVLDELAEKYDKSDFIESDPISTAHKYGKPEEVEVIGFIASLFAYGSRKVFIPKLNTLFTLMGKSPVDYLKKGDFSNLAGFNYRFAKEEDVIAILKVLSKLYNSGETLGSLFKYGYKTTGTILGTFKVVTDYFYSNAEHAGEGFYFMLANPNKGGAMKRMNMSFTFWKTDILPCFSRGLFTAKAGMSFMPIAVGKEISRTINSAV